jgi:8-oxo-dGTP pyrophosphatase MutT (NUDIX family)/5'(3')-deoxyribonucleotidase
MRTGKMKWKVFLDMDGVLADFDFGFKAILGVLPAEGFKKWGDYKVWKKLDEIPHFWLNLKPLPGYDKLLEFVSDKEVSLLTTPADSVKECRDDKKKWAKKYIGDVDVIFSNKKEQYASPNSILIDDKKENIDKFKKKGGIGIHHTSIDKTIKELESVFSEKRKASYEYNKDEVLYSTPWITLRKTPGDYVYVTTKPGVVLLPIRQVNNSIEVLLRREPSELFEENISLLSGRSDEGEGPIQTAIRELKEEAGLILSDESRYVDFGEIYHGRNNPIPDTLFFVFTDGAKQTTPTTDGTSYEEMSLSFWISVDDLKTLVITSKNSLLLSVCAKFFIGLEGLNENL